MFEAAEIGATLSDAAFRKAKDRLRLELIEGQQTVRKMGQFPIILVVAGVRGAGVIDTLNLLNTWMDPRWIESIAEDAREKGEQRLPPFWRYWHTLPASGTMGLYLGGWYADPLTGFAAKRLSSAAFQGHLEHITAFERTLTDSGALLLKFWLHLSEDAQRGRTDSHRTDPVFGFRSSDAAWLDMVDYKPVISAAAVALEATATEAAPWHIVESADDNFRRASVLSILSEAITGHLKAWKKRGKHGDYPGAREAAKETPQKAPKTKTKKSKAKKHGALAAADLSKSLDDPAYARAFAKAQARVYAAQKAARTAGISSVIAFEGWDAAGKGGAIRRLTFSLNAYNFHVVPIAAPTDEEAAHHYLWRFWRHLPARGRITIFDRTWYGRVLVERVQKLIPKAAWKRAYGEIREFERELTDSGTVLIKFWMHIDKDEQKMRLKERRDTPLKRWKLSDDDWRAHKQYDDYFEAAEEAIAATSTANAPWHVIPGNNKHYARIKVLETVAAALEQALAKQKKKPKKTLA